MRPDARAITDTDPLGETRGRKARDVPLEASAARTHLRFRRRVKNAAASLLYRTGSDRLLGALAGSRRWPLVLGYHRVVENFESSAHISIPQMLVSRRMLEAHLDWVGRRYRFVSLDDLYTHLASGEPFDKPVAVVSFDDGYADVYENAFPLLTRKGIPAAVFLVTDLIGTSRLQVYDKLYLLLARARGLTDDPFTAMRAFLTALTQSELAPIIEALEARVHLEEAELEPLRAMTWDQVSAMHRAGVAIGSHTKRHVLLTSETSDVVTDEVIGSRRQLELKLGAPIHYFAYPDGQFNSTAVGAVAAAGYRLAFTTCRHRDRRHPLLTVPRSLLWECSSVDAALRFSPAILNCYVKGIFTLIRRCQLDHRGAPSPAQHSLDPCSIEPRSTLPRHSPRRPQWSNESTKFPMRGDA